MASVVRYGVLSTAQIAMNQHMPAAQAAENAEVVAVSSRDGAKARAMAEKFGVERAYGSYQELLADGEVDAVINPLPNMDSSRIANSRTGKADMTSTTRISA